MNLLDHGHFSGCDLTSGAVEPSGPMRMWMSGVPRIIATKGPYLPEVFRTPGYPAFLATVYWLAGHKPLAAIIVQCLVGVATVVVVLYLGCTSGGPRAGWWAAMFLAIEPGNIANCCFIMADTVYTFVLWASLALAVAFFRRQTAAWLIGSGLLMGAAVLCRPGGIYLPVAVAAWLGLLAARGGLPRVLAPVCYAVTVAAALVPWSYRNYCDFGHWQLSSVQGLNLFFSKLPDLESGALGDDNLARAAVDGIEMRIVRERDAVARNQLEMAAFYQAAAVHEIAKRPVDYARLHLLGTVKLLAAHDVEAFYILAGKKYQPMGLLSSLLERGSHSEPSGREKLSTQAILAFAQVMYLVFLYGTASLGLIAARKFHAVPVAAVVLLATAYFIGTPGSQGISRFRVPAMPGACVLAGMGVALTKRRELCDMHGGNFVPYRPQTAGQLP
jgi:4-amino-4-deoxy-L-arabinose transferase-like glycosyltransferase